jgi:maltodextrin utilization protein YvdJ
MIIAQWYTREHPLIIGLVMKTVSSTVCLAFSLILAKRLGTLMEELTLVGGRLVIVHLHVLEPEKL